MSRSADINALIIRALTSPGNVLPAAAVAGVGFAFGLWPLYLAAVAIYAGAAIATVRSPAEARKVLRARGATPSRLTSAPELELSDQEVAALYAEARAETSRLSSALASSPIAFPEITVELAGMEGDLVTLCRHADQVSAYLASVDTTRLARRRDEARAQLSSATDAETEQALLASAQALSDQIVLVEDLGRLRSRFTAQTLALVSSLGSIRGEVVRVGVSAGDPEGAAGRLRDQVSGVREDMRRLSAAFSEKGAEPGQELVRV